ncbi:MAG: hypothetical protein UV52_C0009G0010 [Parcubacteria group bacterium GW2011_GWD1_42_9]|uniref:Colicin V production protein n=2 Tax=Candidatus Vebleniibacteriota TaxID=1817921 RepID=A0A1G2Q7T8_9BACT|nr:MAG: hypothetical protein UV52_C0009G0010 [Parcubacteria group bacterium GW2011_GWD1_42_9]KKS92771.1 MAG: hypothetical protein UV69_C0022G0002 [Parcubacteria group bacterium GW2011_GWE2_43_12]KKT21588.1 MAG: hypothetical protein UW06_C0034G0009 [Parcubacteria group bacterium GW2011_GWE1_43_8]OHA56604.1 MAG: hypothetical protein A2588_01355 [Candidatus Veblenbacteria bacterium RIFOXYD1_FULL_43_11]HAO81838.1 hypothetical protein [Candidatus Veblenbacteria bacterium]
MTILDFILLITLFGFLWFGFWFGLIHAIGGLVGTVAGAWLAGHFYSVLAGPLEQLFNYQGPWLKLASFLAIFMVANRLVGFGFYLFDKSFAFLIRMPFLKTIDRMAGGVLGIVEGALVIGLTLTLISNHLDMPALINDSIADSKVAFGLQAFAIILVPLLPDVIKYAQPYLPQGVEIPSTTPPIYGR